MNGGGERLSLLPEALNALGLRISPPRTALNLLREHFTIYPRSVSLWTFNFERAALAGAGC